MSVNQDSSAPSAPVARDEVRIRRAPKLPAFMIVGGGLGAIATYVATSLFPIDPQVGFAALFGYFALFGITAGVVLGAVIALVIDRVGLSRARNVTVERETIITPLYGEPSAGEPSAGEPSAGEPSAGEPSAGEPSAGTAR
ncbi:MAG: hypothetical protein ACOH1J_07970 [Microbacteriaceae bacterium]